MSQQKWDAELYEASHSFVWNYGKGLIELLKPQPGERILDIGCGPGQLTAEIAATGATVTGLDSSPAMIGQARQNFPKLSFVLQSVTEMRYSSEFDAVFSNAALHWVLNAQAAAKAIGNSLRKGGRFVAELGGHGNVQIIDHAVTSTLARYLGDNLPPANTYFPTIGEYATILDNSGLEVRLAELYDRPTPLEGENGMTNWIRQFKWFYFEALPPAQRSQALNDVLEDLAPSLRTEKGWFADYRRLRIAAVKP